MDKAMGEPKEISHTSPQQKAMTGYYSLFLLFVCLFVHITLVGAMHLLQKTRTESSTNGSPCGKTLEILICLVKTWGQFAS